MSRTELEIYPIISYSEREWRYVRQSLRPSPEDIKGIIKEFTVGKQEIKISSEIYTYKGRKLINTNCCSWENAWINVAQISRKSDRSIDEFAISLIHSEILVIIGITFGRKDLIRFRRPFTQFRSSFPPFKSTKKYNRICKDTYKWGTSWHI